MPLASYRLKARGPSFVPAQPGGLPLGQESWGVRVIPLLPLGLSVLLGTEGLD